jgi:hypothetical protein
VRGAILLARGIAVFNNSGKHVRETIAHKLLDSLLAADEGFRKRRPIVGEHIIRVHLSAKQGAIANNMHM